MDYAEVRNQVELIDSQKKDLAVNSQFGYFKMQKDGKMQIGERSYRPSDFAMKQIASKLDIPQNYAVKLLNEDPELLALNVNRWLKSIDKDFKIRTLDGTLRAFMSDQYKFMDNIDVINNIFPILEDSGLQISEARFTDSRMHLKMLSPKEQVVAGSAVVGDVVQSGIILSNSEVGQGYLTLGFFLYRIWCENGCYRAEAQSQIKRKHLGEKFG